MGANTVGKDLDDARKELQKIAKSLIEECDGSVEDVKKLIGESRGGNFDKTKLVAGLKELKERLQNLSVHPRKL